ncbi:hypothetical protein [Hyphomonas sp.]|uniref:hypothetical protein n=1 Tax=Hyphomonas sp. TaxID=87 RepID=UPI0025C1A4BB|nr:hypothetical protein [Hyphomonas sp.]
MTTVLIGAPAAAVTAAEAKATQVFPTSDGDTYVDLLLAVAQQSVDGPNGWLGRAIGTQTLELQARCGFWSIAECDGSIRLAYAPATTITSIKYRDEENVEHTIDGESYELIDGYVVRAEGYSWPTAKSVKIRYVAGQAAADVPKAIKHGLILMAAELKTAGGISGAIRREVVEGVGTFDYALPDIAAETLRKTGERLLAPFRVYGL